MSLDLKRIAADVEKVISYSQDYPFSVDCTALVDKWYHYKKHFIDNFGGHTYYRSKEPIKIELSKTQQNSKFYILIDRLKKEGLLSESLSDFLYANRETLFDNKVSSPLPEIQSNSKLSKSLKFFIKEQDKLRLAQDLVSQTIQESRITGYLYMSVDPMDFLTLSENNSHWTSCHSLDGDYRIGNLNYMCDETTMIFYLADEKRENFRGLPSDMEWYDKKWRMLVHINEGINIYYNKQYPFASDELFDCVVSAIKEALPHSYSEPENFGFREIINGKGESVFLASNYLYCGGQIIEASEIINTKEYRGFCDLCHSTTYVPWISLEKELYEEYQASDFINLQDFYHFFGIKVGRDVRCVHCGVFFIDRSNKFLCEHCIKELEAEEDFYLKCSDCNRKIYDDEFVHWENDMPYCEKCYRIALEEGGYI